jgi:hypothetical protein
LYRKVAARHRLTIEWIVEPNVELLMQLLAQRGLSFELAVGLQDGDMAFIAFDGFQALIFPFEKTCDLVERLVDAIVSGESRLVTYRPLGLVVRRELEMREGESWRTVYTEYALPLPFGRGELPFLQY